MLAYNTAGTTCQLIPNTETPEVRVGDRTCILIACILVHYKNIYIGSLILVGVVKLINVLMVKQIVDVWISP